MAIPTCKPRRRFLPRRELRGLRAAIMVNNQLDIREMLPDGIGQAFEMRNMCIRNDSNFSRHAFLFPYAPENLFPHEAYIIHTVKYRSRKQSQSNRHFKDY